MYRHKNPFVNLRSKWQFLKTQYGFQRRPLLTIVRLFSWMARCLMQNVVIVNLRRWQVKMALPGEWRGLGKFLFVFREYYEPELTELERLLSPGDTFVDVGANFGIYTLVARKLVGESGRVIALEPTAQSFEGLQKNIALNNLRNVLVFPVAASDKAGTAWLYYGTDPVRNSLGKDPCCESGGEQVATECLDNILHQAGGGRVDVIKMDAEGAEELVLRGATNLLTSMHPIVIYEKNPEASAHLGLAADGATKLLAGLGYKFFVHKQPGTACLDRLSPGYFNIVAIPRTASRSHGPQRELAALVMSAKER